MRIAIVCLAVSMTAACQHNAYGGSHPLATATRELGSVQAGAVRLRVSARSSGEHLDRCEPTFGPSRECTSSFIDIHVDAQVSGAASAPFAYDPGWQLDSRVTIAARESRSASDVEEDAAERLASLRFAGCADAGHIGFAITTADGELEPTWTIMSIVDGALVGFNPSGPVRSCADALAQAATFDARFRREADAGGRRTLAFMVNTLADPEPAMMFSLSHVFEVDPLRDPQPTLDSALIERLASEFPRNPALATKLQSYLTAPETVLLDGRRGNRPLDEWLRRIVHVMTPAQQGALADALEPLCASASASCPLWRASALLEATRALPIDARCPRAWRIAQANLIPEPATMETLGLAIADALAGCRQENDYAASILATPERFPVRDESFLFPPCLSTISTGTANGRCRSLPTYAVVAALPRCDAATLSAARTAAESGKRPFQVAALAVYQRCGRVDELRVLVNAVRDTPPFREDGVRQEFAHCYPQPQPQPQPQPPAP